MGFKAAYETIPDEGNFHGDRTKFKLPNWKIELKMVFIHEWILFTQLLGKSSKNSFSKEKSVGSSPKSGRYKTCRQWVKFSMLNIKKKGNGFLSFCWADCFYIKFRGLTWRIIC